MEEAAAAANAVARASPPAVVVTVFAIGLLQSLWFIWKKPYSKSSQGVWDTSAAVVSKCTTGSDNVLGLFRFYSFIQCTYIGGNQLWRRGTGVLYFYTVWSYWLLAAYFGLASIVSFRARQRRRAGIEDSARTVDTLEYAVISIYHVTMTTVWIVDSVAWLVLWPMLKAGDPDKLEFWKPLFFCWTAYNQHGINALQMLVELCLNQLPIAFYMMGFVGLYSCAFGLWALSVYVQKGLWIYPFLNYTQPWAPLAYVGLFVVHWAFFGVVIALNQLKIRYISGRDSLVNKRVPNKLQ